MPSKKMIKHCTACNWQGKVVWQLKYCPECKMSITKGRREIYQVNGQHAKQAIKQAIASPLEVQPEFQYTTRQIEHALDYLEQFESTAQAVNLLEHFQSFREQMTPPKHAEV